MVKRTRTTDETLEKLDFGIPEIIDCLHHAVDH